MISLWSLILLLPFLSVVVTGWTVIVRRRPFQSIISSRFQSAVVVSESLLSFRSINRHDYQSSSHHWQQTMCPSCLQKTSSSLSLKSTTTSTTVDTSGVLYYPVFSFADSPQDTVNKFDRIDDVIMGGISNSALMPVIVTAANNKSYAKWFGNIRIDGGGFCGIRTLPFVNPLHVTTTTSSSTKQNGTMATANSVADGFYITCRLVSDNEPERRVWKMSTRIQPDRGEQLYQARFELPPTKNKKDKNSIQEEDEESWAVIQIPFNDFKLVRGPRTILNGPVLNVTNGIYQIGFTVSKFEMAENMTELSNFRPGFFEMQIKEIGVYGTDKNATTMIDDQQIMIESPVILTKQQAAHKRSLIVKILLPIAKVFFSEQAQRRKSAMKILRNKRGLSRLGAIMFGIRIRARSVGLVSSLAKTFAILTIDSFRSIFVLSLKICLVYPIRAVRALVMLFTSLRQRIQKKKSETE